MKQNSSNIAKALAGALAALALGAAAAPCLDFGTGECDLGERGPVETVATNIAVRNVGGSAVRIARVRACCGAKAAVSASEVAPGDAVELVVTLTTGVRPGPFRKTVTVCSDDAERPVFTLVVTGSVRQSSVLADPGGGAALVLDAPAAPSGGEAPSRRVSVPLTLPAVLVAGLVDGFNPCAFSIVIVLAGILAAGGRRRRAQMLGGWAFCAASFCTYMAMGLGLLKAMRMLSGLSAVRDAALAVLSSVLFVLAFLSLRDALRYRRAKEPSVITLQLPDRVKRMIRAVAEASWSGPAVVLAGFGCGFLVTLLDSLCTGQVYVPVLALLAVDGGSARAFALLALYNLAFIAPLVAVFMLSAYGAGSERMRTWSKRNVVPSKVALAVVFAMLGVLLWPGLVLDGSAATIETREGHSGAMRDVSSPRAAAPRPAPNAVVRGNRRDGGLPLAELAEFNDRLNAALRGPALDPKFPKMLLEAVRDRNRDMQLRNHCLQVVPECIIRLDSGSEDRRLLEEALTRALAERRTQLAGTALLGYARLAEATGEPSADDLAAMSVAMASDASSSAENIVTALRFGAERGVADMLAPARYWARRGEGSFVRCVAISAVRDLGGPDDVAFLRSLLPAKTRAEESAIGNALNALGRDGRD